MSKPRPAGGGGRLAAGVAARRGVRRAGGLARPQADRAGGVAAVAAGGAAEAAAGAEVPAGPGGGVRGVAPVERAGGERADDGNDHPGQSEAGRAPGAGMPELPGELVELAAVHSSPAGGRG